MTKKHTTKKANEPTTKKAKDLWPRSTQPRRLWSL